MNLVERHAVDGAVAEQRHHVVAVAAQHQRVDVLGRHAGRLAHEVLEAGGVEHAGHADHPVLGEPGDLVHGVDHRVERVGHHDDEGVRGVLLDRRWPPW